MYKLWYDLGQSFERLVKVMSWVENELNNNWTSFRFVLLSSYKYCLEFDLDVSN